jgi:hypothetical protein
MDRERLCFVFLDDFQAQLIAPGWTNLSAKTPLVIIKFLTYIGRLLITMDKMIGL